MRIRDRDHALRLDVELLLRGGAVFAFDDQIGARERGIHIAFFEMVGVEDIVLAPDDFFAGERFIEREDRRQRLVFDANGAARLLKQVRIGMSEQDDRLFWMIHGFGGEEGLVALEQRHVVGAWNIRSGDDREFAPGDPGTEFDFANASARDFAADGDAVERAREIEIVHIARAARHFVAAFFPRHRMTQEFVFGGGHHARGPLNT